MKKLLVLLALITLASCTKAEPAPAPAAPAPVATNVETPAPAPTAPTAPQNPVVSLNYTLHIDSPTGKVFDTNIESVAKEAGLHSTGATYEPLTVVLGANQVVPGFEANIATMKKGEKKSFAVEAKDGYGEARIVTPVMKREIEPEFTTTVDIKQFQDRITEVVQKSQLGTAATDLQVGQTLTGGSELVAVVKQIDGENVTLDIDNSKANIFSGKEIAAGTTAEKNGATFTIKAVNGTGVTLEVKNSKSPFFGKSFAPGSVGTMDVGSGQTIEVKIVSFSGELATIDIPNPNQGPLVGKTLYFDVEILDIK